MSEGKEELRTKISDMLPSLPKKKDPEEMARRQRIHENSVNAIMDALDPLPDGRLWFADGTKEVLPGADFYRSYFWPAIREAVLWRDGGRCTMCGSRADLEVHHVLPRAEGGADTPRNLRTLCRTCHDQVHRQMHDIIAIDKKLQKTMDDFF